MSSSFSRVLDTLSAPVESLSESDFFDRVVYDLIKAVNKDRKDAGVSPLHMDENCNRAAAEIASKISQIHQATTVCAVIGTEFAMINSEKSHQFPTGGNSAEVVREAYLNQLSTLDMTSRRQLNNPVFTHCGFTVKRTFDMLKIHGILFKKQLCVFHVSWDTTDGIKIRGKMFDRTVSLSAIVIKDTAQSSAKPSVAGPSRIKFNFDTQEFDIHIPRIVLNSRIATEKDLEFYVVTDDPRSLHYGSTPDISAVQPGATLAHKMTFNGLWESNIMIEERSFNDSQFIRHEHDSKVGNQAWEVDSGVNLRRPGTRGRGTALRGRGAATRPSQWGAPSRDTPFKPAHLQGLTHRTGAVPATSSAISSWNSGAPATSYTENQPPPSDIEMGMGAYPEQPSQVSFFPPPVTNPGFPPQSQVSTPYQNPIQTPGNVLQFPQSQQNPFAGQCAQQTQYMQPGQFPQYQQYAVQPPMFVQSQMYNQPLYPSPMNTVTHSAEFLYPQVPQGMNQVQFLIPVSAMSHPVSSPSQHTAYFGRPASDTVFGASGTHSTLGTTLPAPPKVTQKSVQASPEYAELESPIAINKDEETVSIPCLVLPIPIKLFERVRRNRFENDANRNLWTSMEYYDVILKVKDIEQKAHRGVLAAGSPFFKEHLDKVKNFGSASMTIAKLVMPSWIMEKPLKVVLMFMYSCDIEKERLDLSAAREVLALADFLGVNELVDMVIVKYVITQLTKEEVISIMKAGYKRGNDQTREAWTYLTDSCAKFAADNSNWLLRNRKGDCQSLPLPLLFKTIEAAFQSVASSEQIAMLITLLIEAGYAEDIFELSAKISGLCMLGYLDSPIDIRMVDLLRPYENEHFEKLPHDQTMEFSTLKETDIYYLTNVRASPVPPPVLSENLNLCSVPTDVSTTESKLGIGYKQTYQSTPIIPLTELRVKRKVPNFTFSIYELSRPRTIVSPVFSTESRDWFLTVVIDEEYLSLFLCERGKRDQDDGIQLMYTTVACELEVEAGGHAQTTVFLYSYPNGHFHCAGERHMCKLSRIADLAKCKVHAFLKEFHLHSATLHYIAERFDTFNDRKYKHFKALSFYDFRSVLHHDELQVKDERACVSALWKYAATKDPVAVDFVVPAIRFEFLSIEDLCSIARDHVILRQCQNFKHIFTQEYYRRIKAGPISQKPRAGYASKAKSLTNVNHAESLLKWLLTANHHEGYDKKLEQEQKRYEEDRAEFERKRAELNARKHELYLENERLNGEVKKMKKEFGEEMWSGESRYPIQEVPRDYSDLRTPLGDRDLNARSDAECRLM